MTDYSNMSDAELDAEAGFDTTHDPFAERQTRRDAWDHMNRVLDEEGPNSPAYRAAFQRWANMWADGSPKVAPTLEPDPSPVESWQLSNLEFAGVIVGAFAFGFAVAHAIAALILW